jgi:hypothetical protein
MSQRSPIDEELYRRIDEVLQYIWDPIGVSGDPATRDEYDFYLPEVFSLALRGASASEIAAYLTSVTVQRMGLSAAPERDLRVAELVLGWREELNARYA